MFEYNPQAMAQVGQLPLGMLWDGLDYLKQAQGRDQATLQDVMAQRQRAQQSHDLNMQTGQATLEGTMLGNRKKKLDVDMQEQLQPTEIKSKFRDLALKATEDEMKAAEQEIMKGVRANDPNALKLYEFLPQIREERKKSADRMALEKEQTSRAISVANIGVQGRKDVAAINKQAAVEKMAQAKSPKDYEELAVQYDTMAQRAETREDAAHYISLAQVARQNAAYIRAAGQTAPNPAALTPPGSPPLTTPRVESATPPLPQGVGASPKPKLVGPQAEDWIVRAMKLNPGMTREQVIEEGRKAGKL